MRYLLLLTLSAVLLFGGYWVFAAQMIERQGTALLSDARQIDGRVHPVTGFPLTFRTTLERPVWRSRDGNTGWSAAELGVRAASYLPNKMDVTLPEAQSLRLGGLDLPLATEAMTGTVWLGADQTLRLLELDLTAARIATEPQQAQVGPSHARLTQIDGTQYALDVQIADLDLAPALMAEITGNGGLDPSIARIALSGVLEFTRNLSVATPIPDLHAADLSDIRLDWGNLQAQATGALARSATGALDGQFQVTLQDWQPFHAILLATGALPPDAAMFAGMFLASQAAPGTSQVTLQFDLRDQVLALGPFALAQLPRF